MYLKKRNDLKIKKKTLTLYVIGCLSFKKKTYIIIMLTLILILATYVHNYPCQKKKLI